MRLSFLSITCTALCLSAALPASADIVAMDAAANGPRFPTATYDECCYSLPSGVQDFQQLYNAAIFPSAGTITGLEIFYRYSDSDIYTFSFSTSPSQLYGVPSAPEGISSNLADNRGADGQVFYTGPMPASDPVTLGAVFSGTPFYYDPAKGNLLLEITHDNVTLDQNAVMNVLAATGAASDIPTESAWSIPPFDYAAIDDIGLVTIFDFQPATVFPEPAALALMLGGLIGLGVFRRR